MTAWRSLLFVPASDDKRLASVHTRGADAVIVDLEDGVAPDAKAAARAALPAIVADLAGKGCEVLVRINGPWRMALADLEVAVRADVRALLIPKVESAARLASISEIIGELEAVRDLEVGALGLVALIETPAALAALAEIAAVPRVVGLALGSEDFSLTLGVPPSRDSLDLPCKMVALAAAGRGLAALALPGTIAEFRDLAAYEASVTSARAVGATGAVCIHPAQVAVLNTGFSPTEAEHAWARAVLGAWDAPERGGRGVVSLAGAMIDLPVVERARRLLAAAALGD
jgi:citrate lyase subunit beta/citryl-CoA lyase